MGRARVPYPIAARRWWPPSCRSLPTDDGEGMHCLEGKLIKMRMHPEQTQAADSANRF
jgi:hypothetical protein